MRPKQGCALLSAARLARWTPSLRGCSQGNLCFMVTPHAWVWWNNDKKANVGQCLAKGAMEVRPSRGSVRENAEGGRERVERWTSHWVRFRVQSDIEGNDGQYIQYQLLLTRMYIYYVNMRFTCDKESCPKSDGLCASWCPIAFK